MPRARRRSRTVAESSDAREDGEASTTRASSAMSFLGLAEITSLGRMPLVPLVAILWIFRNSPLGAMLKKQSTASGSHPSALFGVPLVAIFIGP